MNFRHLISSFCVCRGYGDGWQLNDGVAKHLALIQRTWTFVQLVQWPSYAWHVRYQV